MIDRLFNTDNDRRFLVSEVVQTSEMDCGPAALKALLEGYGIPASYGRLREACQTDVDGTSIDTLEEVASQLGFAAEQVMLPADHLLLASAESLPAIIVVRLANGMTHFVVAWNQIGPLVQVMDPATGRRWVPRQRFLEELYLHTHPVPAADWHEWATSDGFCAPLRQRLLALIGEPDDDEDTTVTALQTEMELLVDQARQAPTWQALATLDAATRMVTALIDAQALLPGDEAWRVLQQFYTQALTEAPGSTTTIPLDYWSAQSVAATAHPEAEDDTEPAPEPEDLLLMRGVVLVRVLGRLPEAEPNVDAADQAVSGDDNDSEPEPADQRRLSPELIAALEEQPSRPAWEVWQLIRADGLLTPLLVFTALLVSGGTILIEALILRSLLDLGANLGFIGERLGAVGLVFAFLFALLLLEFPLVSLMVRMGRRLETRLRLAFLEKIPRLNDRYFQSRLISDMAQRAHTLRQLRNLPDLASDFVRICFQIVFTAVGIIWLDPWSAPLTLLATISIIGLPFLSQPLLVERDLRLRSHLGALSRFYLDALLGLLPIRTHGAERSIRREHESLLVEWVKAGDDFYRVELLTRAAEILVGWFFAVAIVFFYIGRGGEASGVLLLFYWALNMPILGRGLLALSQQYPLQRNRVLRLLEPLNALEDETPPATAPTATPSTADDMPRGAALVLEDVLVQASGHPILQDINLRIEPGEHVAIVGPSGAGKSSLVGILLGWHQPAQGRVLVDGRQLRGEDLQQLRREIAWIDPAVQLWNRSLLDNLRYGNEVKPGAEPPDLPIEQANLFSVLEKLPDGLQTRLGEGGGLVSGGEGQRVRLGRAMYRAGVRLVILDEPFRGLDRAQRTDLLERVRDHWRDATVLFISHDVGDTQRFDRVLVIEEGRITEDNQPAVLGEQSDSRYRALLDAEAAVRSGMWSSDLWRRLWLEQGQIRER